MERFKTLILASLAILPVFLLNGCDDDLEVDNDIDNNFEILWKTVDERYCFFDMKKDSIMDWNYAYDYYLAKAHRCKSMEELFYTFGDMLNELKDGHVNLISSFDVSRYDIQGSYKDNFISNVIYSDRYLGRNYRKAGGLSYKLLGDNIGYIYYGSFSDGFSEDNLSQVLNYFRNTKGLIIDIRGNGGGYISYVDQIAGRFTSTKLLSGYWQRKTGKGHSALSDLQALYLEPSGGTKYLDKPVAVLTNRDVFSAANNFAQTMKVLPQVKLIGDVTGGGSGLPISNELPCGWFLRFSSAIYYDAEKVCTEWGIQPDIQASLDVQKAYLDNEDSIIETARQWIVKQN